MCAQHVSLAFLFLAALFAASRTPDSTADKKSGEPTESIERLVEQLGDDNPKVREEATRKLKDREDALPALRRALRSPDEETRQRAKDIIAHLDAAASKRSAQALLALAGNEGIDCFVDKFVALKESANDDCWSVALELAKALASGSVKETKVEFRLPDRNFLTFPSVTAGRLHEDAQIYGRRISAESIETNLNIRDCLAICDGPIRTSYQVASNVLFSNGKVMIGAQVSDCFIFCDGDIEVGAHVRNSVILATGTVKARSAVNSVIIARGGIKIGPIVENSLVEEKSSNEMLRVFDLSRRGIEVADSKTEVKVEKVHDNKPFAKAGFRKGDLVLAIADKEIKSYDDFRKAVRRNFVDKTEPVFKVKRGDQTLELKVSFKG